MTGPAKAGLVAAGYAGAGAVAFAVVAIYVAFTSGPDRAASSGMYAFGDSLLFLAVFGLAAIPASGAAFYFLRPHRAFWRAFAAASLAIAATGLVALADYLSARGIDAAPLLGVWSPLSVLRILVAPLFGLTFFLSAVFAPRSALRLTLLGTTAVEGVVFAWFAAVLFHASQR